MTGTSPDVLAGASLRSLVQTRGVGLADAKRYVNPGEELAGFGVGGSEALVLLLRSGPHPGRLFVRKVVSELVASTRWDPEGRGVMSPPRRKAQLQVDYLESLPESARPYFPRILDAREQLVSVPAGPMREQLGDHVAEYVVDQSYVPGIELSSYVAQVRPSPQVVARIYEELLRLMSERLHVHRAAAAAPGALERSYLEKIERRVSLARRTAPHALPAALVESDWLVLNGERLLNTPSILRLLRSDAELARTFDAPRHCLTMGDANTENVKISLPTSLERWERSSHLGFSYDDIGLRLLDPRAIGVDSEGAEVVDDYLYDTKFWHNSLGNYDLLHGGHFDLDIALVDRVPHVRLTPSAVHPYRDSYEGLAPLFDGVMERGLAGTGRPLLDTDPNWLPRFNFLMGSHFCAMVPFHFRRSIDGVIRDDWRVQRRPAALYCEGLRWLNRSIRMAVERMGGSVHDIGL